MKKARTSNLFCSLFLPPLCQGFFFAFLLSAATSEGFSDKRAMQEKGASVKAELFKMNVNDATISAVVAAAAIESATTQSSSSSSSSTPLLPSTSSLSLFSTTQEFKNIASLHDALKNEPYVESTTSPTHYSATSDVITTSRKLIRLRNFNISSTSSYDANDATNQHSVREEDSMKKKVAMTTQPSTANDESYKIISSQRNNETKLSNLTTSKTLKGNDRDLLDDSQYLSQSEPHLASTEIKQLFDNNNNLKTLNVTSTSESHLAPSTSNSSDNNEKRNLNELTTPEMEASIWPPPLPSKSAADSIASDPTVKSVDGPQDLLGLGAIIGIILGVLTIVFLVAGIFGFLIYRRRLRPLSEVKYPTDNCGYVDDSLRVSYMNNHIELPKENSEEMFSLDNDSFLNSLEAMTLQNYWAEDAKNTKV